MSKEPMVYRKVKVRAIVEYEIPMWDRWQGKEEIEAYLNEYTRCHDHMIEEIQDLTVREGHEDEDAATRPFCLCPISKYEYVGEVDSPE
jgi:hypothetical protein